MKKIIIQARGDGSGGFHIPSEYNKLVFQQWIKDGITFFDLVPRKKTTKKQQGFLEGAVIPTWAKYQYDIDPRDPKNAELMRTLFKYDFNFGVIKNAEGEPKRVPLSLKGKHRELLQKYIEAAPENGFPIPNAELYKTWRDQYSMDTRWSNYWDWLDFVGLEVDAMPSRETLEQIKLKAQ